MNDLTVEVVMPLQCITGKDSCFLLYASHGDSTHRRRHPEPCLYVINRHNVGHKCAVDLLGIKFLDLLDNRRVYSITLLHI